MTVKKSKQQVLREEIDMLIDCENTMRIFGYSERGIINSLMFNIGEDKELMTKFIKLLPSKIAEEIGNPVCFKILLEHSLSGFGSPDLIIIAHYKNPKDKKVIFFEAKVKVLSYKSFSLKNLYKNYRDLSNIKKKEYSSKNMGSNLFVQLKLKKLLSEQIKHVVNHDISEVYGVNIVRNIGDSRIVHDTLKMIGLASEYYFIGIVPENDFVKSKDDEEEYNFLTWEKIYQFCQDNKLQKVLDMFKYNEGQIYNV